MNHFIAITDHPTDWLQHVLDVSKRLKKQLKDTGRNEPILAGKTLAMIFEKPSLRTRVSFSTGMVQLGGASLMLRGEEMGWGHREEVRDVARVVASMCDGIMARTFEHAKVVELAKWSRVPVLNGLTDYNHPCQAMADFLTIEEHFGKLSGLTMAFIGDGNNVTRSLAATAGKFGVRFILAAPQGYELPDEDVHRLKSQVPQLDYSTLRDPIAAVREADVIVTDTWVSMGQEAEKQKRLNDFAGFAIDAKLLAHAPKQAVVLHCLPAYRGYEISDDVMEGSRSLVFPEAENRLHAQKGLLAVLMGGM
ncbi:MAG: ornithine carbamoyltransferase [Planctomycetota bacterium]|nr:ornithine carbamoyltransferase [Planctomycetota bacterium]